MGNVGAVEARDRFIASLAKRVSDEYYSRGEIYISIEEISQIATADGLEEAELRAVLRLLNDNGLLIAQEGGHSFSDGVGLMLRYEEADRQLFWSRNALRRQILQRAVEAFDQGHELEYQQQGERFVDVPWEQAFAATKALEYLGMLEIRPFMGGDFDAEITSYGDELSRDLEALARALPTTAAEDVDGTPPVAADALARVIRDVKQLLHEREWVGAARELRSRADCRGCRSDPDQLPGVVQLH